MAVAPSEGGVLPSLGNTNGRISPGYWNGLTYKKPLNLPKGMTAADLPGGKPYTGFEESYVARKAACQEEVYKLKNGRHFCYVVDGPGRDGLKPGDADCKIVLCLHGSMCNKWQYLQEQKFDDICCILIDRIGHGGSSAAPLPLPKGMKNPVTYGFDEVCADLKEFMEEGIYRKLQLPESKKYHVIGHSMGATIAMELAACPTTKDRIAACAPCSCPSAFWPGEGPYDPEDWNEVQKHVFPMLNSLKNSQGNAGAAPSLAAAICCCCAHPRWARYIVHRVFGFTRTRAMCDKRTGDFGVGELWDSLVLGEGDVKGQKVLLADRFQVSAILDCMYPGHLDKVEGYTEFGRCFGKEWDYPVEDITCPTFIYQGTKEETPVGSARYHEKRINKGKSEKVAHLMIWDGHGHNSLNAEYCRIIKALCASGEGPNGKPKPVEKPLWEL